MKHRKKMKLIERTICVMKKVLLIVIVPQSYSTQIIMVVYLYISRVI